MKKIYCKNCKWYKESECRVGFSSTLFNTPFINHKGSKHFKHQNEDLYDKLFNLSLSRSSGEDSSCQANSDFQCPLFECKMLYFWVTPKKGPTHILVEMLKK